MNGHIIPDTPIAVDYFKVNKSNKLRYIHFCTHAHSDHTQGLTSTWRDVIYTSPMNAKLVVHLTGVDENLVKTLAEGETHVIPIDESGIETMCVTVIPANHIVGAVMFLFEGYFGRYLYTGDFRYKDDLLRGYDVSNIDVLYLDNTYCDPSCEFPTREQALEEIVDIINRHCNHEILIGVDKIGKEEVLIHVAQKLQEKVLLDEKQMELMKLVEAPDVFTLYRLESRITALRLQCVNRNLVRECNQIESTIAILPTARYSGTLKDPYEKNCNFFVVPYSNHSSFSELQEFVSFIKPKRIIPIVLKPKVMMGVDVSGRSDMTCFAAHINTNSEWKPVWMPEKVRNFMKFRYVKERSNAQKKTRPAKLFSRKSSAKGVIFSSPSKSLETLTPEKDKKSIVLPVPVPKNNIKAFNETSLNSGNNGSESDVETTASDDTLKALERCSKLVVDQLVAEAHNLAMVNNSDSIHVSSEKVAGDVSKTRRTVCSELDEPVDVVNRGKSILEAETGNSTCCISACPHSNDTKLPSRMTNSNNNIVIDSPGITDFIVNSENCDQCVNENMKTCANSQKQLAKFFGKNFDTASNSININNCSNDVHAVTIDTSWAFTCSNADNDNNNVCIITADVHRADVNDSDSDKADFVAIETDLHLAGRTQLNKPPMANLHKKRKMPKRRERVDANSLHSAFKYVTSPPAKMTKWQRAEIAAFTIVERCIEDDVHEKLLINKKNKIENFLSLIEPKCTKSTNSGN